jgi:hypothetical protein
MSGGDLCRKTDRPLQENRNGTFAVLLGKTNALTDALFAGSLFLEIRVGSDPALTPRRQLATAAYAFKADTVPDGSIGTNQIADGAVTAAKLANGALNPLAWLLGGNGGTNPAIQFLGTTDSQPLVFKTNNAERMRLLSNGNVGIGTNSPLERLDIVGSLRVNSNANVSTTVGSGAFKILNTAGTAGLHFDTNEILCLGSSVFALNGSNSCETRINSTVFITTTQRVGIGDSSPDFRLELPNIASDVGGRGRANAWVTYSSGRWKHNITPIADPLEKVLRLNGVMFDWNAEQGGGHDIGFVAEEAGRVVPELVTWEDDRRFASGMKYDRVTALLVEAVKQQQRQIEEMKRQNARIAVLEAQLAELLHRRPAAADR